MQSHQEYTPAACCWCPALEMLSDCHAWKIQSSPDNGGFPVLSSIHKRREPTYMLAPTIKNRYVAHYNENVLLLSRLQPTCFILAETVYWLCSRCNLQTGYLHTSRPTCFPVSDRTYRHNRRQWAFLITRSLLAHTWQNVSNGGAILCSKSATILFIFGHFGWPAPSQTDDKGTGRKTRADDGRIKGPETSWD